MRIAILGSGGVGGYFGGRLAAAGADVAFIARGKHLAALRERGLTIDSPLGNLALRRVKATDDAAGVGPVDVVFFTVKLYDTASAVAMLPPLIGPDTLVVPLQNGVDSIDVLTAAVGRAHVAGGTTYVSAVIAEPGVIRHTAMNQLIFGPIQAAQTPMLERLRDLAQSAGIDAVLSDRIILDVWAKFARLTVFSGMTSITRCPIGTVLEDPDLFAMVRAALHESIAVARGRQIPLPANTFNDIIAAQQALPPTTKSSMLEDLERGRPLELPWLSGAVVRLGNEAGVDTPTHRLIVMLLRPHVRGVRQAATGV
jgi:2-dehydropantoate 2-reductase